METKAIRILASITAVIAFSTQAHAGCFTRIEYAAADLGQALNNLAVVAARYEAHGATESTARQGAQAAGYFQSQIAGTCNKNVVYSGNSRVRNAVTAVNRAFRMSPVLPQQPDASRAFEYTEAAWDILRDLVDDLGGPGPLPQGGWYAVRGADCYQYCASHGLHAGVSPEGAQCVSGENRAASALGQVPFAYGCWPNCAPESFSNAVSYGSYCYKPGQKKDNDRTDITVGCFCRR